ncbi:hypothetical protein DL240_09410 [Lujinxingia litoralis]|uniref:Uncharacterized protein n=1 Tax=Lujinxingia litoralis TaxID=2211119 RepID=A0A328CBD6_9DELT|nr:hypothetical protein [Lujinxingia litoralis]RAL23093.1 hypothetical protein DL240_09410 [Lujinxingia litoralis]
MLIGYNNDVEHRGKTFHIQTEDRGSSTDTIETQLFHGGAILDTRITNYAELIVGLTGKTRDKKVKSAMQASHRTLYKKLLSGEYDHMVGLEPQGEAVEEDVEAKTEVFNPSQERVPAAALAVEEGQAETLEGLGGDGHVGLSQLKDKLANLKESSASVVDEAEVEAPVQEKAGRRRGRELSGRFNVHELKAGLARAAKGPSELPSTGVAAYNGLDPIDEDLSLTELVEAFIHR